MTASEPSGLVKAGTAVVDALRSSPLLLALVVINVLFLAVLYVAVRETRADQHAEMRLLLERCLPKGG